MKKCTRRRRSGKTTNVKAAMKKSMDAAGKVGRRTYYWGYRK